ncbi:MlaA family lipoprotein [Burkholderia gladioli]|uniref:VacJ like lipofamily protein n=1 Tax=Burkholderia gladioli TaxID=28095 RepID=A0AAW7RGF5_BURGA|nr:VacJ family lipoprotein [Burkholderia gladioli]AJW97887.1 vacJ like lipofamily protein [Burkholderia gladioli]ASD77872.1 ABC transporter [Burkholderia gladioli pv. gladioli]AWY53216.1 ABC transporter [Burkholderia gladioli pv. gladioli]KAF1063947.1 putative phospholipid-binding lipoprotein MlaA [Burkholderia gladioli]KGC16894.1 vacJ like lipofamily protein [Burkholderia gladioli]
MQTMRLRNTVLAVAAVAAMSGCATVQTPTKGDPFEGFNRTMYKFNDTVDTYALKPVAKGYQWAVPQPVRDSVTNFFSNIGDVYIAANNLVQLRIADGVGDIMRVVINTVFGVGGLFDVATVAKLPKHTADFGLTMGHYGVPSGPYVVLPFLGPSTVRDTAGLAVDYAGNPLTYVSPDALSWSLFGVNLINTRANLLGAGDVLDAAAIDKYSFVRNAYLQRRQSLIAASGGPGGRKAAASVPDYSSDALPKYDVPEDGSAPAAPASGADAASSAAAAPDPSSATHVPAQNVVPPSPNGLHWPSLRLH